MAQHFSTLVNSYSLSRNRWGNMGIWWDSDLAIWVPWMGHSDMASSEQGRLETGTLVWSKNNPPNIMKYNIIYIECHKIGLWPSAGEVAMFVGELSEQNSSHRISLFVPLSYLQHDMLHKIMTYGKWDLWGDSKRLNILAVKPQHDGKVITKIFIGHNLS